MSHMTRGLSLARLALGSVSPNPAVGSIVVKNGVVVGEGSTQPPGQDHAEVVALQHAGNQTVGAILYTTLEPCNYHGRTPPCTQAIIDSGLAEVHVAMLDPNPSVSGGGIETLNAAGIRTFVGERESEAQQVTEAYCKFVTTGIPFVTTKFAMSLDGKIATRTGDSQWISSVEARQYTNALRATSDAIMVGINTVLTDDPRLTVRDDTQTPTEQQPLRVVVDSHARIPSMAKLLSEPGNVIVAVSNMGSTSGDRLANTSAEIENVPADDGSVDLEELMRRLGYDNGVTSVLVEGGGTLLGSLFDLGLVDKVVAIIAPVIIGGDEAPSPVGGIGVEKITDMLQLSRIEMSKFGNDIVLIGYC